MVGPAHGERVNNRGRSTMSRMSHLRRKSAFLRIMAEKRPYLLYKRDNAKRSNKITKGPRRATKTPS